MIQVITTVELRVGVKDSFLSTLKDNMSKVKGEDGCLAYDPMVDVDSVIFTQKAVRSDTVTVMEAWRDMESLRAHLSASHMLSFREKVKKYVLNVDHQVLQPV